MPPPRPGGGMVVPLSVHEKAPVAADELTDEARVERHVEMEAAIESRKTAVVDARDVNANDASQDARDARAAEMADVMGKMEYARELRKTAVDAETREAALVRKTRDDRHADMAHAVELRKTASNEALAQRAKEQKNAALRKTISARATALVKSRSQDDTGTAHGLPQTQSENSSASAKNGLAASADYLADYCLGGEVVTSRDLEAGPEEHGPRAIVPLTTYDEPVAELTDMRRTGHSPGASLGPAAATVYADVASPPPPGTQLSPEQPAAARSSTRSLGPGGPRLGSGPPRVRSAEERGWGAGAVVLGPVATHGW